MLKSPRAPAQPRNSSAMLKWPESRASTSRSDLSQIIADLKVKETCSCETSASGSSVCDTCASTFRGILSIIQRLPLELVSLGTELALILMGSQWRLTAAGALALMPLLHLRLVVHSLQKFLFFLDFKFSVVEFSIHPKVI